MEEETEDAEDEEVKMRVAEILVAQHQENARTAARQGDWGRVNFILNEARAVAKDHEWLHKVIDSIEVYAKQKMFLPPKVRWGGYSWASGVGLLARAKLLKALFCLDYD